MENQIISVKYHRGKACKDKLEINVSRSNGKKYHKKKAKGGEMHQDRKINSFIKGDAWSISRNHQGEEKNR